MGRSGWRPRDLAFHPPRTLLILSTVNNFHPPFASLPFLILCLGCWQVTLVLADDDKPAAAASPATAAKPTEDAGKEIAGKPIVTAQPTKEEIEDKFLEKFKKPGSITNTLGMVMVWLPGGYRVDRFEVTQQNFERLMKSNPSKFLGDSRPLENVTWEEAAEFCKKITEKERAEGKIPKSYRYALPTEQQWEYYVDEAELKDAITSHLGDRRNTENVGGLAPNQFGLYDVRGNVWEWCSTPFARGGSWRTYEDYLEISFRYAGKPGTRYDDIGFRCVLMGP